jgi:hypothetical protein
MGYKKQMPVDRPLEYNKKMMGSRNKYFGETENKQMTPCRYPNFNSYVENQRVLEFQTDGRMDERTDRRTDG